MLTRRNLFLATSAAAVAITVGAEARPTAKLRFVAQLTASPFDCLTFRRTLAFHHPGTSWELHGNSVVVVVPSVEPGEMDAVIAPFLRMRFHHKPTFRYEVV